MQNRLLPHPPVVIKIWEGFLGRDFSGARSPSSIPGTPAQDSSARKITLCNFWLQKPAGIESVEETSGVPSSSS